MFYRLLIFACLIVITAGCGVKVEPSKEAVKLQGMSADEVAYTYDAIVAMSDAELAENFKSLNEQLTNKRNALPPSAGGASVGGGETEVLETETTTTEDDGVTVESLALPLEVMKQEMNNRK